MLWFHHSLASLMQRDDMTAAILAPGSQTLGLGDVVVNIVVKWEPQREKLSTSLSATKHLDNKSFL